MGACARLKSTYLVLALVAIPSAAQVIQPAFASPQDRIVEAINPAVRVAVPTPVHSAIASAQWSKVVDPEFGLSHMILTLQPSASQQAALSALLEQQQEPTSANFHKFLTPAQFAASFGVSSGDVARVTSWLSSNGFHIDEVVSNNLAIVFSGTAAQMEATFNTQIRQYAINGEMHYANASVPEIPSALSSVIQGFAKLNDFHSKPPTASIKAVPQYTSGSGAHYLVPADYAIIYNLNSLYSNGFSGTSESIAVVGRSNINPADIANFQASYGLPSNPVTPVYATGTDPGITGGENTLEGTIDLEWAGAVAPHANLKYVIAASTQTTDGLDLAAQYAISNNVAPILSVSFASCEASANNSYYNNLWQQAAAQGISVFVSAGDSGAAGCESSSGSTGTFRSVNAICSTPFDTCVGGTMFNDTVSPSTFWMPGNNAVMGSAISYIPEIAWNESGSNSGTGSLAGGGGASGLYAKPYWQTGTGVPADNHRDVPDVSLSAAQHDGYMIYYNGGSMIVSGTSVATPAFAGMIALVNQKVGSSQGNINQILYPLATATQGSASPTFHDITSGNNSVPGVTGYSANIGYDLVSGIGSVDATQLANTWTSVTGGFTLTASSSSVSASPGSNGSISLSIIDQATFNSPVTLNISNLPAGVVANFSPGTLTGSGTSVLAFAVSGSAFSGTYPITVTAKGGSFSRTVNFNLVVTVTTGCTLSVLPTSVSIVQGAASSTKVACGSAQGVFASSLMLSVSGVPAGVTTSFSPNSSLAAGSGSDSLVIAASTATTPGTYTLIVTATLPNSNPLYTSTVSVPLTINAPSTFNVTPSVPSISFAQGASGSLTFTSSHSGSFNSPLTFSISGLPSTITAALSTNTVAAPGDGTLTISLAALTVAVPSTYTMTVLVQGGGLALRLPIAVQITTAPAFTLTGSVATMTLHQTYVPPTGAATPGTSTMVLTTGTLTGNFNSAVAFTTSTLPSGVTAAFSSSILAAPGSGSTTLTLTAAATATTGISKFTIYAMGGTITRSLNIQLVLMPPPSFNLSVNYPAYTLMAGSSMAETVTATPLYGYNSNIQLTGSAPAGFNIGFTPTTISGAYGTSKLTIQPAITVAAGNYPITVTGTDPITGSAQTAQISFQVASISTSLNSTAITAARGTRAYATITTTATAYSGNAVLALTGLPPGVSYVLGPTSIAGGTGSSALTLLAAPTASPGVYLISVKTTAGAVTFTTTFTLTIT